MTAVSREEVEEFCASAGANRLLVQGAGGNASWKDGDTMWIKASGTWLSDAGKNDIFVPVDLSALRVALCAGDCAVTPVVLGASTLRPSIETVLHALMPHQVVVHLHAIDVLAHLVQPDWQDLIAERIGKQVRWVAEDYRKPGAELAAEVAAALRQDAADVVFLKNHGVVIGGASVQEVEATLSVLEETMHLTARPPASYSRVLLDLTAGDAVLSPLAAGPVHSLALDPVLFARLSDAWALYPDHVVFLGAEAPAFSSIDAFNVAMAAGTAVPEFAIIAGVAVYAQPSFGLAKQIQLQCYYDVLARLPEHALVHNLSMEQIGELLSWESEKYRMKLAK